MGPCYFQSLSEDVVVTFGEYCESFAAHQVTLLSCSMVGTCQTPQPSPHYHLRFLLLQLSCLGPVREAGL